MFYIKHVLMQQIIFGYSKIKGKIKKIGLPRLFIYPQFVKQPRNF